MKILYVLENECRVFAGTAVYKASKGDIIVIKENPKEQSQKFRMLDFDNRIMINFNKPVGEIQSHITAEEIKSVPHLERTLDSLFRLTDREDSMPYTEENLFFQSLATSVYFLLLRHFPAEENEKVNKSKIDEFYMIIDYINTHYKEDIGVQTIADALYFSRTRMTRLFAKYSETRITDYINHVRIKEANQMLAAGKSAKEAALGSGFRCVRTFNSAYKAHMGITPTEYQKSIKK